MKNQITRWAKTQWGKFANWLKMSRRSELKRPKKKRYWREWRWCWKGWRWYWWMWSRCWRGCEDAEEGNDDTDVGWFSFSLSQSQSQERERRKSRSSRKAEHRKEVSTSSLPVSDKLFIQSYHLICNHETLISESLYCWIFLVQLSAHERSHQRSRSAQPLVNQPTRFNLKFFLMKWNII